MNIHEKQRSHELQSQTIISVTTVLRVKNTTQSKKLKSQQKQPQRA